MKYRAEIDGLRALAVVPVILFHAGFELFSGGFVGVDVFFVISGYLITTILIEDIENKRFSIVNFYERRARRILPALFFVMLVCIPFAWMWMLPIQMKDFSQSLVAVSLFASNILFWRESGYFDAAAEEKPLLHTWSLAVEEQYYVLFPIFLILAWRFGKNRVFWMIVVMAAISLLLSEWGWRKQPTANFYLATTRAWELFAGSIAAFVVQKQGVQRNNLLALAGLVAILFSIFFYDESTPFPSVYALVPVLGVVLLVLYADKETLAAKVLSTKGFVRVGLISYSAYLWHQPLFAFARIRSVEHPSFILMSVLSFVSILLAYFSWRYVEAPTRKVKFRASHVLTVSVTGLFLFAIVGVGLIKLDTRKFNGLDNYFAETIECSFPTNGFGNVSCSEREPNNGEIVFVGDSLLNSSWEGIEAAADNLGIDVSVFPKWGCPSLKDITRVSENGEDRSCSEFNKAVYDGYMASGKKHKIILFSAFNRYLHNGKAGKVNSTCYVNSEACVSEFEEALKDTVVYLQSLGHRVYVVEQPPRYEIVDINNPNAYFFHLSKEPKMTIEQHINDSSRFIDAVSDLGVKIISFRGQFCSSENCSSVIDGQNYYVNGDHFGAIGASKLSSFWEEKLKEISKDLIIND